MSTKDILDAEVLRSYVDAKAIRETGREVWPLDILEERTGQCEKVCWRAMERASRRGLIDSGVSLRSGWLTDKGLALLGEGGA